LKAESNKSVLCYCAFCRNPRTIYRKAGSNLKNAGQAFALAFLTTFLFWGRVEPKGLLLFVGWLIVIETVIHFRARMEVACPHCGFDPVLYIRNKEAACEKVKRHIVARQSDPDVWLARKPPLRFAKRKRKGNSTRELVV
jgi:hypothetical protein